MIAEIFSSTHEPTFSYAELLKYRKEREGFPLVRKTPTSAWLKERNPAQSSVVFHQEAKLLAIDDDDVRDMVRSMLSLEPAARGSATDYVRCTIIADGVWVASSKGLSLLTNECDE